MAVSHTTIEHLFWNEFPFRLIYKFTGRDKWSKDSTYVPRNEVQRIKTEVSNLIGKLVGRTSMNVDCVLVYFRTRDEFEQAQKLMSASKRFILLCITQPSDDAHIEYLKNNQGCNLRKQLWFGKYEWRVRFKKINSYKREKLLTWLQAMFDDLERAKIIVDNDHDRVILYLRDEGDITMVKLCQSSFGKAERAIPLKNYNHKEGESHEPSSVQEAC